MQIVSANMYRETALPFEPPVDTFNLIANHKFVLMSNSCLSMTSGFVSLDSPQAKDTAR